MMIKTTASFFKGNRQVGVKTNEVVEIFLSKIVFISKKLETNTIINLQKSAKILDGAETGTIILLNRHKTIPSTRMPNASEINIHTIFSRRSGSKALL